MNNVQAQLTNIEEIIKNLAIKSSDFLVDILIALIVMVIGFRIIQDLPWFFKAGFFHPMNFITSSFKEILIHLTDKDSYIFWFEKFIIGLNLHFAFMVVK